MELKAGYKKTEVGVIPEDWEVKPLADIADIATGTTPLTSNKNNYGEDYFFVSPADLGKGKYIIDTEKKLSKLGFSIARKYPAYSILFTCIGSTIGKAGIAKIELTSNQQINAVFPNDLYCSDFLFYYLNFISPKVKLGASEQAVPMINKTEFGKTLVTIPFITEQIAIATALSDADALICGLEKLIVKKRNIKQGAMQKLLQPKEGWKVKKLGEIATIVRGASPRPIDDPKWFDETSLIGWVRISDVTKSVKILTETTQKLSELGIQSSRYVEEGNLIMSICATVGRPILTRINVCIHDGFVVFKNPQVHKEYLYYFLSFIEKDWSKNGQTGSQMNLNTTLINTTEIPVPPTKEQQIEIATILSDMDTEITALETKLEKYKNIKLGIMQNLLTGRIRLL